MEKVSFDLLNRLVEELNAMKAEFDQEKTMKLGAEDRHLMVCKMMGIASGVSSEAAALINDMVKLTAHNAKPKSDYMALIESLVKKAPPNSGNGN